MEKPYAVLTCPNCGNPHYDLHRPPMTWRRKRILEAFTTPHLVHECSTCRRTFGSPFHAIGVPKVSFIVAVKGAPDGAGNYLIGNGGGLPWDRIPGDMIHFKRKTVGRSVVVGHRTWKGSPVFPLKNRQHWVMTRTLPPNLIGPGYTYVSDIKEIFSTSPVSGELVVIGGAQIYGMFAKFYSEAWVTYVDTDSTGDVTIKLDELLKRSNLVVDTSWTENSIVSPIPYKIVRYTTPQR